MALELQVGMAANSWTVNLRANRIEAGGVLSEAYSIVRRRAEQDGIWQEVLPED
jgi:hypothetical protein